MSQVNMLTVKLRPRTFDEVIGQELPVEVLKAASLHVDRCPSSFVFEGAYGAGKTTLSRIFAKALNCKAESHKPCLKCSNCLLPIENSPFYYELDSAIVGNVETVRQLREDVFYQTREYYKVITLDEAHGISQKAQAAFLKVIEEAPPRVVFIFVTTNPDQLINTIHSRSITLHFSQIPDNQIREFLLGVFAREGYKERIQDDTLDLIISRSNGHMRDALMMVDECFLIGQAKFKETVFLVRPLILQYVKSLTLGEDVDSLFEKILRTPLQYLKADTERAVMDLMRLTFLGSAGSALEKRSVLQLFTLYSRVKKVIFDSTSDYASFLAALAGIFTPQDKGVAAVGSRFGKKSVR